MVSSYTQPANGTVVLNPDGSFTYTPAADWSGEDSFAYISTSITGVSNEATVYLHVNPVNDAPVVTNPGPHAFNEDDAVSLPIAVTDVDSDAFIYSASNLPPGLTINPMTGLIWGWVDPQGAGSYTSTVTVDDMEGGVSSVAFDWAVGDTNHAPRLRPFPNLDTVQSFDYYNYGSPQAVDIDGDPLTFTVTGLPPGIDLRPGLPGRVLRPADHRRHLPGHDHRRRQPRRDRRGHVPLAGVGTRAADPAGGGHVQPAGPAGHG